MQRSRQLGETIAVSAPTNSAEVEPLPWRTREGALREAGVEDMVRPTSNLGITYKKELPDGPSTACAPGSPELGRRTTSIVKTDGTLDDGARYT